MTFAPVLAAGPAILIHLASTSAALALGVVMLARRKGTVSHKKLGWAWVVLMAVAAGSSFFITGLNPGGFSPIHILSVITLLASPWAIHAVRRRNLRSHRWTMISIFTGGLVVAGIFTLLPGRLLGSLVFGG